MKAEEIRIKDLLSGPSDMPGDNIRDCAFFLQEVSWDPWLLSRRTSQK